MIKKLARFKVYFDRARVYISYAQTVVVVITMLKVFNVIPPAWAWPILVVIFVAGCLFVGWIDCKLGIFDAEQRRVSEQNPILIEILEAVKKRT